jgi:hypothetical protein
MVSEFNILPDITSPLQELGGLSDAVETPHPTAESPTTMPNISAVAIGKLLIIYPAYFTAAAKTINNTAPSATLITALRTWWLW